ncbi:uncharacterized protein F4812DRAFT_459834 [Daldinia caldariorum]|uniref:uncharacterized protein n=1 Tax=Daldinia caldariorum TaxID=326644 RepID=UPI002008620D|nr:uncharacterized protein F4812DRAFT_459834 [Daldinia caldariorum]KAI1467733.1 hypothetical protein F4812DRAFT_459834 [Daldinia caldariorum]
MKFLTTAAITTLFAGVAVAAPAVEQRQTYTPCSGTYGTAQCCATDVLGVADLDCANPSSVPTDASNFTDVCAAGGQRARCCVLPILGQGVLCQTPSGVTALRAQRLYALFKNKSSCSRELNPELILVPSLSESVKQGSSQHSAASPAATATTGAPVILGPAAVDPWSDPPELLLEDDELSPLEVELGLELLLVVVIIPGPVEEDELELDDDTEEVSDEEEEEEEEEEDEDESVDEEDEELVDELEVLLLSVMVMVIVSCRATTVLSTPMFGSAKARAADDMAARAVRRRRFPPYIVDKYLKIPKLLRFMDRFFIVVFFFT